MGRAVNTLIEKNSKLLAQDKCAWHAIKDPRSKQKDSLLVGLAFLTGLSTGLLQTVKAGPVSLHFKDTTEN